MEFRNPFGVRNGEIVMIDDIPKSKNGLKCKCVCPACGEPFEARMGDVRRHHFAHSGQGCDETNSYMKGLYMIVQDYLKKGSDLYLPAVIVRFPLSAYSYLDESTVKESVKLIPYSLGENNEEIVYKEMYLTNARIQDTEIISSKSGKPEVLLVKTANSTLAIRVRPPDTVCKEGISTRYRDYSTLEIDLSSLESLDLNKKEKIFAYLNNEHSLYTWIYNTRIERSFQKIINRTKAYYEASQARIKKQQEERKKLEEQMRIEAIRREKEAAEQRKREEAARIEFEKKRRPLTEIQDNPQLFVQKEDFVYDLDGNRWIRCEECGAIKLERDFADHVKNIGTCTDCVRKPKQ